MEFLLGHISYKSLPTSRAYPELERLEGLCDRDKRASDGTTIMTIFLLLTYNLTTIWYFRVPLGTNGDDDDDEGMTV